MWEHTFDDVDADEEAAILDSRSAQGWELVAVRKLPGTGWRDSYVELTRFYFKKSVPPAAAVDTDGVPAAGA